MCSRMEFVTERTRYSRRGHQPRRLWSGGQYVSRMGESFDSPLRGLQESLRRSEGVEQGFHACRQALDEPRKLMDPTRTELSVKESCLERAVEVVEMHTNNECAQLLAQESREELQSKDRLLASRDSTIAEVR